MNSSNTLSHDFQQNQSENYSLDELNKESRMGSMGKETEREVRIIDLSDFEQRKYEIADQLWNAAIEIGFFRWQIMAFHRQTSIMPLP